MEKQLSNFVTPDGHTFSIKYIGECKSGVVIDDKSIGYLEQRIRAIFSMVGVEYTLERVVSFVRTVYFPYYDEKELKVYLVASNGSIEESVEYVDGRARRCSRGRIRAGETKSYGWLYDDGTCSVSGKEWVARLLLNSFNDIVKFGPVFLESVCSSSSEQDMVILICSIYKNWFKKDYDFAAGDVKANLLDIGDILELLCYLGIYSPEFDLSVDSNNKDYSKKLTRIFERLIPMSNINLSDNTRADYMNPNDYMDVFIEHDKSSDVIDSIGNLINKTAADMKISCSEVLKYVVLGCSAIQHDSLNHDDLKKAGCDGIPVGYLGDIVNLISRIELVAGEKGSLLKRINPVTQG